MLAVVFYALHEIATISQDWQNCRLDSPGTEQEERQQI
jgi:hypothetical protein